MQRICIGFFGFIRNPINYKIFNEFKSSLPENSIIDIFITCPNKVNEYDNDTDIIDINSKIIKDLSSSFDNCNIYIDIYNYEPLIFIKKARELGLPDYTNYPIYRLFSLHYSISRLSTNIIKFTKDNNINYNSVIITRFDIMNIGIKNFSNFVKTIDKNMMYVYRYPYNNRVDADAEDRIIISSIEGIEVLCNLYDNKNGSKDIYNKLESEAILSKYLISFPNIKMLPQDGMNIPFSPSLKVKYSNESRKYLNTLIEKYKEELA